MDANTKRCMLRNGELIVYGSIFSFVIPSVIMIVMFILMVRKLRKQLLKLVDNNNTEMKIMKPNTENENFFTRKLISNKKNGKFLTGKYKTKKDILENMDEEESCMTSPPSISSNNEISKTHINKNNSKTRDSLNITNSTQYQLRRHISTSQTVRLSNGSNPSNISSGSNFFKTFFIKHSINRKDNFANALNINSISTFKTNSDMNKSRSVHTSNAKSEVQNEVKGN